MIKLCFFLFFSLAITARAEQAEQNASIPAFLQCLAKEEADIHRNKITGARAKLNQELFSLISSGRYQPIKEEYLRKICTSKTPSLSFLRVIILHREEIFKRTWPRKTHAELFGKIGKLFINYLSLLQATTPDAHCLEREIPFLEKIHQKYKTIEGDVGIEQLLEAREVKAIFNQLKNIDRIIKSCHKAIIRRR